MSSAEEQLIKKDISFCEECEEIVSDFCRKSEHEISSFVYLDKALEAVSLAKKEGFEKGRSQEQLRKKENQIDFDEFLVNAKNKYQDKKGMYKIGGFDAKITDNKERTEKFKNLIDTLSDRVKDNRGAVLLFFTFDFTKVDENFVVPKDIELHFAHISIDVPNALIMCFDFLKNLSKQHKEETK